MSRHLAAFALLDAVPLTRPRTGQVKPLPDTGTSKVGGGSAASPASPATGGS
jgi:hypothetical protein